MIIKSEKEKLTAINISALEAEKIEHLSAQDVLISVNNPTEPLHKLSIDRNSEHVLTLSFFDITGRLQYKGKLFYPISNEEAAKIVKFINKWQHKNFIIHCTAGVSRSSAIALFINLTYGHGLKPNFWEISDPNPYVLGKLVIMHSFLKKEVVSL